MKKVFVNGINMCYDVIGEGFPLVAMMGLTSNMDWWLPEIKEELGKYYKLIIMDNRGTGQTDAPEEDAYLFSTMAKDTVGLMNALHIKEAYILGLSSGGMTALEIAVNYPERVKKLVLGCTSPRSTDTQQMQYVIEHPGDVSPEDLMSMLFPEEFIISNPELIQRFANQVSFNLCSPESIRRQAMGINRFDVLDKLNEIKVPTLIITGDKDNVISCENSVILEERIPESKRVVLPGVGHAFFIQEQRKTLDLLMDFLS